MRRIMFAATLIVICGLNAAGQYLAMRSGFDNQIFNRYAIQKTDSLDYVKRAVALSHGHVIAAFGDAHRIAGYPLFLTLFQPFAQPQLMARFAQLALSALLPFFFALILRSLGFGSLPQIGGALAAAVYPFFYYFTPILYAEELSLVAATLLLLVLARLKPANAVKLGIVTGLLMAALVYLKPNHLAFAAPVIVFGLISLSARRRTFVGLAVGVMLICIAPWTIFATIEQHQFVPLTTVQGVAMWNESGSMQPPTTTSLPDRVARHYGFFNQERVETLNADVAAASTPQAADMVYQQATIDLWKSRPVEQAIFSAAKAAHAFGFSLRGPTDMLMAAWTLTALGAAATLFILKQRRAWASYLLAAAAVSAVQAFFFQSDQRFKMVLFDPAAFLVVVLAALSLYAFAGARLRGQRQLVPSSGEWSVALERLRSL